MNSRRPVLLSLLAVALGIFLLDVHGSPRQLLRDLRETWTDLRQSVASDTADSGAGQPAIAVER